MEECTVPWHLECARVGDLCMSLIPTEELHQIEPFH